MRDLRKLAVLCAAVLAVRTMLPDAGILTAAAATTQQQIEQKEQEKNELEEQLGQTQENLEGLRGEHNSLKGELNNLNEQLSRVSSNLEELEEKIAKKELDIENTQAALEQAKETERLQYQQMVDHVRYMYELKEEDVFRAILKMDSFAEMLNAADYYEKVMSYNQKMMEEYKENRRLIEEEEARLEADMAELESLRVAAEAEKSKVSGLISKTSNAIDRYADQISDAEAAALAYEASIKEKEEDLEVLREQLKRELAMSQAAANATWRDISEVSFEEGDRYLLANLIYCEAGGEPYAGQLAVGSVVVNRVLSSLYPDTIVGVIYQNKQFSPVASGRFDLALASNKATESCYRAADEAMSGVTNVGSCVYFRTPVEGLSGINIGGHVFY